MNKEQIFTFVRWGLTMLGSYLVARGTFRGDEWNNISEQIIIVIGGLMALAPIVQGLISKTKRNQVITVSQLPEVAAVVVKDAVPTANPVKVAAESLGEASTAKVLTETQVKS